MSSELEKNNLTEQMVLLAELTIKLVAIERLLTEANIFTSDKLASEIKKVSEEVASFVNSQSLLNSVKN